MASQLHSCNMLSECLGSKYKLVSKYKKSDLMLSLFSSRVGTVEEAYF